MTSAEVAVLRQMILDHAAEHGLSVDAIYEEELESLLHFAGLGNPMEVRRDFQSQGIRVLVGQR